MVREDFTEESENRSDGVFRYVPKQRDKEILPDLCGSQEKQRKRKPVEEKENQSCVK